MYRACPYGGVYLEGWGAFTPQFNMQRMVKDYTNKLYVPAQEAAVALAENHYAVAHQLAAWKQIIRRQWHRVRIDVEHNSTRQLKVAQPLSLVAHVHLADLSPEEVRVEIVVGVEENGQLRHPTSRGTRDLIMSKSASYDGGVHRYEGSFTPKRAHSRPAHTPTAAQPARNGMRALGVI